MCSNRTGVAATASALIKIHDNNDTTIRQATNKQTQTPNGAQTYRHTFQVKHITVYFRHIRCWHSARSTASLWPYGKRLGRCRANESVNRNVKNLSRLPTANDSRVDRHALTKAIQRFTPRGSHSLLLLLFCICFYFSLPLLLFCK